MRKPLITISLWTAMIVAAALGNVTPGITAQDDPEARRIMEMVDARDNGDNQTADMEMILIDKNGTERIRKIASFSKDKGDDTLRLMFFLHPADAFGAIFVDQDHLTTIRAATTISGSTFRPFEKQNALRHRTKAAVSWGRT